MSRKSTTILQEGIMEKDQLPLSWGFEALIYGQTAERNVPPMVKWYGYEYRGEMTCAVLSDI